MPCWGCIKNNSVIFPAFYKLRKSIECCHLLCAWGVQFLLHCSKHVFVIFSLSLIQHPFFILSECLFLVNHNCIEVICNPCRFAPNLHIKNLPDMCRRVCCYEECLETFL